MTVFIDTSVVVAGMIEAEHFHAECRALIVESSAGYLPTAFWRHTGGRKNFRLSSGMAAQLLEEYFVPRLKITALTADETLGALREADVRGVRGGGVFDYLHLVAARKANAERFYTLNMSSFQSFRRVGDPEVVHP